MPLPFPKALAAMVLLFVSTNSWGFERERLVVVVETLPDARLPATLGPLVADLLTVRGYRVLHGPAVDAFIQSQGIVRVSDAPPDRLATLLQQFRADGLVLVKLTFYLPVAERRVGPEANPALGLVAVRVGPQGRIVWRSSAAAIADEIPPGSGNPAQALASLAAERALWSMLRAPEDPALLAMQESLRKKNALRQQQRQRPATYRAPERHRVDKAIRNSPRYNAPPKFRLKMGKYRVKAFGPGEVSAAEEVAPSTPKPESLREAALPVEVEQSPDKDGLESDLGTMNEVGVAPSAPAASPSPAEVASPVPTIESSSETESAKPPLSQRTESMPLREENAAARAPEEPASPKPPEPDPAPSTLPAPAQAAESSPQALSTASRVDEPKRDIAPKLREGAREELPPAEKLLPGKAGSRQLQASVTQKQPDVRRCVDGQLKRVPTTSANATVMISIGGAGRVTAVSVDSGKLKGSYFEQCLKSTALKSWVFPYSGSEYELELPIQIVATDG